MPPWLEAGRARGVATDLRCARALHRAAARPLLQRMLWCCSRAGDAPVWFAVVGPLLWITPEVGRLALLLGAANLLLYWPLKALTRRSRPCVQWDDIRAFERASDQYSFPSGHTLHAVAFAVLLSAWQPLLAPLLIGFALLLAASRVVLGVHYPSDVLAGAAIGAVTGTIAAQWLP